MEYTVGILNADVANKIIFKNVTQYPRVH